VQSVSLSLSHGAACVADALGEREVSRGMIDRALRETLRFLPARK
jgi:hypothetical protein